MNEIIININEANKAQKYKEENELFQIEAFRKITDILQEHSHGNNTNDIVNCRFHDTIFIDGGRGVGKTAFMLNIEWFYKKQIINNEKPNQYIFLNSIDPTLLEHTEKFLSVVLAKIVEMVTKRIKNNYINEDDYCLNDNCEKRHENSKPNTNCIDSYYMALENLSKSLEAIKTMKDDVGIEEIASNKSSLKLEQRAHEFFQVVCKMFDIHALVILIDDVDMAFDKGFDVLEVVRKYLASPFIIPVVAGDMNLYREIVETKFMDKIEFLKDIQYLKAIYKDADKLKESQEYEDKKELINNLVEQYLRKIFPSEYQIKLKDIYRILQEFKVLIRLENNQMINKDKTISIEDLRDFEIKHINMGINQKEFYFDVFSNNTRDFIQYLCNKKDIYKHYNKYPEKYISANNMNLYKESFKKTAEFYKFSNDRKKKELSTLSNNDYQSFNNEKYNLYKAFTSKDFSRMNKFKNIEISVDNFSIHGDNLQKLLKMDDNYKNISNYIIDLFIFNDYYSSHKRRNYIYSGKFLESMIYSFSIEKQEGLVEQTLINQVAEKINNYSKKNEKKIDLFQNSEEFNKINDEIYSILYDKTSKDTNDKELSNKFNAILTNKDENIIKESELDLKLIANKIPFGAEFLTNNRYKKEEFQGEDAEEDYELKSTYDLGELSRAIIIWKNVFLNNIELNSISMFEIVYKFFTNIEKIKSLTRLVKIYSTPNSSRNEYVELNELKENQPLIYLQRIVLIFINSIAFFENGNKNIANINMAIGKEFNLKNILSKSPTSLLNIKPMFNKENSLTRALFFHPIVSHILFPQDNSKLNNLDFTGYSSKKNIMIKTTQSIKELKNKFDKHYTKFFSSGRLRKELNLDSFYQKDYKEYIQNIFTTYDNLTKIEKEIALEFLTDKDIKYDKAYRSIKDGINNQHIDEKYIQEYYKKFYNN